MAELQVNKVGKKIINKLNMQIRFLERVPKALTPEEKEEIRINKLKGDYFEEPETIFIYKNTVLDTDDVVKYTEFDQQHVMVRDKYGFISILKCSFKLFQVVKEMFSGVQDINNFAVQEQMFEKMTKDENSNLLSDIFLKDEEEDEDDFHEES